MYEGKNIHYSPVDNKPLCSFSGKVCNQRRLNKFAFCVRHILEDPHAPFKRCAYVAKSSKQTCTQPIPKNEDREYCNNHMQVLGMLPKKERKPKKEKEKEKGVVPTVPVNAVENQHVHQSRANPRVTVGTFKKEIVNKSGRISAGLDDPEDPYAFPADPQERPEKKNHVTPVTNSVGQGVTEIVTAVSPRPAAFSPFRSKSPGDGGNGPGGPSTLAKMYPELAEKLEKIKPKVEPKVKGKVKSSRTMNSLQTKIAQNKIKDKLKRNQESSSTSSQSQSPCHGFNNASSPGFHLNASSPSVNINASSPSFSVSSPSPGVNVGVASPGPRSAASVAVHDPVSVASSKVTMVATPPVPTLTSVNPPLPPVQALNPLNSLNFNLSQLGLPLPSVSEMEQTIQQLAKAANLPLDGALFPLEGAPGLIPPGPLRGLPAGALLPPQLLALHHLLRPPVLQQHQQAGVSGPPPPPYPSLPQQPPFPFPAPIPPVSLPNPFIPPKVSSSGPSAEPAGQAVTTPPKVAAPEKKPFKVSPPKVAPPIVTSRAAVPASAVSVPVTSTTGVLTCSSSSGPVVKTTDSSKSISSTNQSKATSVKVPSTKSSSKVSSSPSSSSTAKNRQIPTFTLPVTLVKPRKLKNVLSEKDMVKRLKTESAIAFYKGYLQKRTRNHHLLSTGFGSSDDDSDSSDCDMLPWQPEWFIASSDEEANDEDDDLDYDLRTTKLALVRARLRRQCFQSRKSHGANSKSCQSNQGSILSLIKAAKEQSNAAVKSLNEVSGRLPKPVDKYKLRGLEKRQCCYRNDEDVRCPNTIVPYTNHCSKHVMYNVDQQLFEYCTAKFSDNTQCCVPVIDIKHELPLCMEHGVKADNYQKIQESEPKPKRPRKKTKPSALTRPPKKGKKKKNQRKNVRPQKPLPPDQPTGDIDMPLTEDEETAADTHDEDDHDEDDMETDVDNPTTVTQSEDSIPTSSPPGVDRMPSPAPQQPSQVPTQPAVLPEPATEKTEQEQSPAPVPAAGQSEELENLGALPELDSAAKMFGELPLETASKLLMENDFQDVLNKIPYEAFDLFTGKNGEFDVTNEEVEELEKSLAMATRDYKYARESFDQMSTTSQPLPPILDDADELTKQIAEEIFSQNLGPDTNFASQSLCNGDDQESIKAIARSLSSSGMMITSQNSTMPGNGLDHSQGPAPSYPGPPQTVNNIPASVPCAPLPSQIPQGLPPQLTADQVALLRSQLAVGQVSSQFLQAQNLAQIQTQLNHGQGMATAVAPDSVSVTTQGVMQASFNNTQQLYSAVSRSVSSQGTLPSERILSANQNSSGVGFRGNAQLSQQQLSNLVQLQQQRQQQNLQLPTTLSLPQQLSQLHRQQHVAQQQLPVQQFPQQQPVTLTPQQSKGQKVSVPQAVLTTLSSDMFAAAQGQAGVPGTQVVWTPNPHSAVTSTLSYPNGFPASANSSTFIHNTSVPGVKFTMTAPAGVKDLKPGVSPVSTQYQLPQSLAVTSMALQMHMAGQQTSQGIPLGNFPAGAKFSSKDSKTS